MVAACDDKTLPVGDRGGRGGAAASAGAGGVTGLGMGGVGGAGASGASSAGGAGGRGDSVEVACAGDLALRLAAVPLRPLDAFAYRNTMQSLLGVPPTGDQLPRDQATAESEDDALARNVPAYHRLAHDQALAISQDPQALASLLGCDPSSQGEALCEQRLFDGFVTRAFRRPLAADEVHEFTDVFNKGRTLGGTFASGVRAVVEVTLQSPEVLYLVEWGERARPDVAGIGRPTPFEMASRLSYLIWGSPPDDMLWAAATQGALREGTDVGAQARRLLADPRARDGARHFLFHWLDVPEPSATATARERAFHDETRAFIDAVLWEGGDGTLATLLTAPWSYVDAGLAAFYGIVGVAGTELQRVPLPSLQRSGLLTQGSFLASHPTSSQRGLHVWQQLLCDDTKSADPLGSAFGHYDAAGAWQDTDAGRAIDSSVVLTSTDAAGSYDGAPALLRRLADSRDVQSCHVRKWMEFAYGRTVEAADACSTATLAKAFAGSGGNIPELFWQLTQTEAFLSRAVP